MGLRDVVSLLERSGDDETRIDLPVEVGFGMWRKDFPTRLRKLGLDCGMHDVSTSVKARFPVYVVTVSAEGPASNALTLVRSLEAIR